MRLRDELGPLFRDAEFLDCYGKRGRPGYSPAALMLVLVLQFVEKPTDAGPPGRWPSALGENTPWACIWRLPALAVAS